MGRLHVLGILSNAWGLPTIQLQPEGVHFKLVHPEDCSKVPYPY